MNRIVTASDAPTFRFWVHDFAGGGVEPGLVGLTGLVEADFDVYIAAPGNDLPGTAISATDYAIVERGRGHYDIDFSVSTYFTGSGPSSMSIDVDDGVYTWQAVEVMYLVAGTGTGDLTQIPVAVKDITGTAAAIIAGSVTSNLLASGDYLDAIGVVRKETAAAGAAGSITLDASASASNDLYNGLYIAIVGGTGDGQTRRIRDYVGATKVATIFPNWAVNPDNTSVFIIFAGTGSVEDGGIVSTSFASGAITATAVANNTITNAAIADNAISATKLAADAITAAKVASDVSAEIADAVWDEGRAGHVGAGSFGEGVVVNSIANNAITAAAISANAITSSKIATDAIGAAQIAAGAIASDAFAAGAITAAAFAAGAIDAAAIAAGAIDRATFAQDVLDTLGEVRRNTAAAGAAGSITLDAAASATNDTYNGLFISIVGGTGQFQTRRIRDYVGGTQVATVAPNWTTAPDNTSVFVIHSDAGAIEDNGITTTSLASSSITASSIAANAITSAKIAADAIGATQIANGAIDAATFAAGAIDAAAIADNAIDAASIATGAITAAKFAAGAIDAAAIANAAIDQATFATDALDLFRFFRRNTATAGAAGSITLDAGASAVDDFYNGAMITLVGGTGALQARPITDYNGTTKVATVAPNWATNPDNTSVFIIFGDVVGVAGGGGGPTAAEIADAVWDEALAGHVGAGTAGKALSDTAAGILTAGGIADAVWDEALAGHLGVGSAGEALDASTDLTLAAIADSVWDEALAGHSAGGSTGEALTNAASGASPGTIADAVWDALTADHNDVDSFGAIISDIAAGASPAAVADAVWDEARAGHVTAGTFGEGVPVKTIAVDAIDAASLKADAITEIQSGLASAANLSTANTNISAIDTKLGTPVGVSVSADIAAVSTKLGSPAGASVSADVAAVKSDTASTLTQVNASADILETLELIGAGRWKIQGTQLIVYDSDGVTPLLTFNLKDDLGNPSNTRIFERVPV